MTRIVASRYYCAKKTWQTFKDILICIIRVCVLPRVPYVLHTYTHRHICVPIGAARKRRARFDIEQFVIAGAEFI